MTYAVSYFIRTPGEPESALGIPLEIGKNLETGERYFESKYTSLDSIERDLLRLAAGVFAADRATARGKREQVTRRITISVPVVNATVLMSQKTRIEQILRLLSNDAWQVEFRPVAGTARKVVPPEGGRTLLFSGGLDSLSAAFRYGDDKQRITLVSHITRNQTISQTQTKLVELLAGSGRKFPHHQVFVSSNAGPPAYLDHDIEGSQRTRSFLFFDHCHSNCTPRASLRNNLAGGEWSDGSPFALDTSADRRVLNSHCCT